MTESLHNSVFSKLILALAILLVILLVFQAGVVVGYRRGAFSYYWNARYYGDVSDPASVFASFLKGGHDNNPHGAVGEVVSSELPLVMIKGSDFSEQMVMVSPTTTIRRMRGIVAPDELRSGDHVIVIGEPGTDGRIFASFIRVLPFPAGRAPASSTSAR